MGIWLVSERYLLAVTPGVFLLSTQNFNPIVFNSNIIYTFMHKSRLIMVKIFVGGLRPDVSELDLVMFISLRAQVNTIKIVRDKVTKRCKGYAFLEMSSQAEAEKAVSLLNGETYQGQALNIKISEEAPVAPKVKVNSPYQKKRPRI